MSLVNKVMLLGNLGGDPELKQTTGGTSVCTMKLATNERVKKGETWEDHTEWHTLVCFGKTAENCAEYLGKGSQISVEGKIRTEKYEKDGETKWFTKIVVDEVKFLSSRKEAGNDSTGRGHYKAPADVDVPF
jgi:single-strand DNA-binding protein